MAHNTYLLSGMPARASLLKDPTIVAAQGADITQLYEDFAGSLSNPNTIIFPANSNGLAGNVPEQTWLNRAFSNYIMDKGDLSQDLKGVEQLINTYRDCATTLPPFDPVLENATTFIQSFNNCARKVDPTFGS